MTKVPFEDLPILTWSPDADGQPHIAMFPGLPIMFKDRTRFKVHKRAEEWRAEELRKKAEQEAKRQKRDERRIKDREKRREAVE
ncbi:hypothetical protein [Pseudooceanicola atlanticus]|uniref:hypothetical protein n=1 Tax=Pseudooceanicola atlanticus TaxID=1461694 RepID=UPI0023578BBD|nr:hypothetical protein [Pseudooceanicola atlanticus]